MRLLLQSARDGELFLVDAPAPSLSRGFAIVETRASAMSVGSERAFRDLAQKSLLGKALERPDQVRQVIEKIARDGVASAWASIASRLEGAMPIGYACAGVVLEADVASGVSAGDRVALGGLGYANHSEVTRAPKHLIAKIPEGVAFEDAAFASIASVALHAVRTGGAMIGERVVVVGLGLVGLIAAQILVASGCHVIGVDPIAQRRALAESLGVALTTSPEEAPSAVLAATDNVGADLVLVAASSTSSAPIELAANVARHRGRVVSVGATRLELPRRAVYEKELTIAMSTSYGPGRYDPSYEEGGHDYPIGHVRWTEQRNMSEALRLMAIGKLRIAALRSRTFPFERAADAYAAIAAEGADAPIGVTLTYAPREGKLARTVHNERARTGPTSGRVRVALVGAGAYAKTMLMPLLAKNGECDVRVIVSRGGRTAIDLARRFDVPSASSDLAAVLADTSIDAVVIATDGGNHAPIATRALEAGKHVLVEKPPALTLEEIDALEAAWRVSGRALLVGYNRDFAPSTRAVLDVIGRNRRPIQAILRCNAGPLQGPAARERWLMEGCHFVALASALADASPKSIAAHRASAIDESVSALVGFEDGSSASIIYTAFGDRTFDKERVEVFAGGAAMVIEDFARWSVTVDGATKKGRTLQKDKGQSAMLDAFFAACRGTNIDAVTSRMLSASRATLLALESIGRGVIVKLA